MIQLFKMIPSPGIINKHIVSGAISFDQWNLENVSFNG